MFIVAVLTGILAWIAVDTWAGASSRWYTAAEPDLPPGGDSPGALTPIHMKAYSSENDTPTPSPDRKVILFTTSGELE